MNRPTFTLARLAGAAALAASLGLAIFSGTVAADPLGGPCATGAYAPLTNAGASPNAVSQATIDANPDMCGHSGIEAEH